jgi:hypothetical protein
MADRFDVLLKPLFLTEEEAMALLEMCLLTTAPDSALNFCILRSVGDLCRRFLRAAPEEPAFMISASRPSHPQAGLAVVPLSV